MRRTLDPDTRESTLKRSMRRTRTAPLITPFTCREREGEDSGFPAVPYFFPPVGSRRGGDGATHGRPVPTPWLVSSSFSSDATL